MVDNCRRWIALSMTLLLAVACSEDRLVNGLATSSAIVFGTVATPEEGPVEGALVEIVVWDAGCGNDPRWARVTQASDEFGSYRHIITSAGGTFEGCLAVTAEPPGAGLQTAADTGATVTFTLDRDRNDPRDSVRVDLVMRRAPLP